MASIVIDCRESKLIDLFKRARKPITTASLELGDIHIIEKDISNNTATTATNRIKYIIERKTIDDLIASLKDGRYKEQKLRVLSSLKTNPYLEQTEYLYLIEGNTVAYKDDIKKSYYGTYISLLLRDNIKIVKTDNLEETTRFLNRLIDRINSKNDLKPPGLKDANTNVGANTYLEAIKSKKKDNVTPASCQSLFLNVIPGISINIATKIMEKYVTICDLYDEYKKIDSLKEAREDKSQESNSDTLKKGGEKSKKANKLKKAKKVKTNVELKEELLKDIQIGSSRKLGCVLSKRVYNYLLNIDNSV
jgi:ERCC4-type nuclease